MVLSHYVTVVEEDDAGVGTRVYQCGEVRDPSKLYLYAYELDSNDKVKYRLKTPVSLMPAEGTCAVGFYSTTSSFMTPFVSQPVLSVNRSDSVRIRLA